ncbi:YcbK family protein [Marivivens aquimaris]|uniref:YcbK family protein n=1 Tax=Marivivens aquimaris TaxID=2774876 RepID=UPI001881825E|nr:DUF882 domain-containing protein [Marivivens aquimaris]
MHRRKFITGLMAATCGGWGANAGAAGLLARGNGALIDLGSGASMYERYDAEPEPDHFRIDIPRVRPSFDFAVGTPQLTMYNVHTEESIAVRPMSANGVDQNALRQVNHFMRDWRRNEVKPISEDTVLGLLQIQQAARRNGFNDQIRFLSGYRSRATNDALRSGGAQAARNSLHIEAKAVDFSLPGVGIGPTIAMAKELGIGGVGGYSTFVHIDSGRVRYWGTAA